MGEVMSHSRYSPLAKQFSQQFPGYDLPSMLAKFSLPVSLSEFRNPLDASVREVSIVRVIMAEIKLLSQFFLRLLFYHVRQQRSDVHNSPR